MQKVECQSIEEVKKIKPNSVKDLLLLGIINDIPENYHNLSIVWEKTQLNDLKKFTACDLKLANLSLGLQNHGSTYPSHICECKRPKRGSGKGYEIGPLRTLGSIRKYAQDFKEIVNGLKNPKENPEVRQMLDKN